MTKPAEEPPTYAKISDQGAGKPKPAYVPSRNAPGESMKSKAAAPTADTGAAAPGDMTTDSATTAAWVPASAAGAAADANPIDRQRIESIAVAAYHKAERRGFQPNHDMDDWLQAEAELHSKRGQ